MSDNPYEPSTTADSIPAPAARATAAGDADETLAEKDFKKIWSLAVLHMGQYFPQGFVQQALPAVFRQQGLPLDQFWLLSIPTWPRWIKFAIAMIVDNFGNAKFGYRRSWILPCTAISAVLYLSLALVQPVVSAVGIIVTILVVKQIFMTAQDVAIDAYISERLTAAERPSGASIVAFLASLGGFIGSGCVALIEQVGWSITMTLASALLVLAAAPAVLQPEPPPPRALAQRRARGEWANPLKPLLQKDARLIMPNCFFIGWVESFALVMVSPFMIDHGMTLTQWGIFQTCMGILGRGSAAFVVPKVIDRFGLQVAALIGALGFLGEGAFYSFLFYRGALPPLWVLILSVAALNFMYMHYLIAMNTSRYRWVSKQQAGTDYSTQSSFYFFGISVGMALGGFLAAAVGYGWHFIISFAIAACLCVFYALTLGTIEKWVADREADEVLQEGDDQE